MSTKTKTTEPCWLVATGRDVRVRDGYDGKGEMREIGARPIKFTNRPAEDFIYDSDVRVVAEEDLADIRRAADEAEKQRAFADDRLATKLARRMANKGRFDLCKTPEDAIKVLKKAGIAPPPERGLYRVLEDTALVRDERLKKNAEELLEIARQDEGTAALMLARRGGRR